MTPAQIDILKQSCGKRVEIRCADGEVVIADVLFVSDEDGDVVYDLVSSSRPERYTRPARDVAWSVPFGEVESVTVVAQGAPEG